MSRNDTAYHRLLNTPRWRGLRAAQLGREPFCADCARHGVTEPATEVHHVVPVERERDPERMRRLAYDPMNLVSLCRRCHRERHRSMGSQTAEERLARARAEARAFWERFG